jgi:hypothetical protein
MLRKKERKSLSAINVSSEEGSKLMRAIRICMKRQIPGCRRGRVYAVQEGVEELVDDHRVVYA